MNELSSLFLLHCYRLDALTCSVSILILNQSFRHLVELLGWEISPSQGFCSHGTTRGRVFRGGGLGRWADREIHLLVRIPKVRCRAQKNPPTREHNSEEHRYVPMSRAGFELVIIVRLAQSSLVLVHTTFMNGVNSASYPVGTRVCFPAGKAAGAWG